MQNHFISYSSNDGQDVAFQLVDALESGSPSYQTWLDKRDLLPVGNWDTQIDQAIRNCEALIFVMTPDSVADNSVCHAEWVRALKFKKPLVLVRANHSAELPFQLGARQFTDFSTDFEAGLASLRRHLGWLKTDAGRLYLVRERLADAQRDLRRAQGPEQLRIEGEIQELREQIRQLEAVVEDPAAAAARVEQSIAKRMEGGHPSAGSAGSGPLTKFINAPPMISPVYFQDRFIETRMMVNFLRDDAQRLMTIVGRGGVGKTTMVCRLLRTIECGQLPNDLGMLVVDGIIYLSEVGTHNINVPNLFTDLCKLLPNEQAAALEDLYREEGKPIRVRFFALAEHFQKQPVVVLLDNLEHLLDGNSRTLLDQDLAEALRALLDAPHHRIKILITTRVAPGDLPHVQPQRQCSLTLDAGLESPYAENILRELDAEGILGLRTASMEVLAMVRVRTRGFPRALEAFYGILLADRATSLEELLSQSEHVLPERVVETLVGEAFTRLDRTAQLVMQALAIYARPVPPVALDFLLQPWLPTIEASSVLNRLVNMHFVRKERGLCHIHPIDQEYVLNLLPEDSGDEPGDGKEKLTRKNLRYRAAAYYRRTRLPQSAWKQLADLGPQFAEFDLRCAAGDYVGALSVLSELDFNYLLTWGHIGMVIALHERLRGNLENKGGASRSLGILGTAYWYSGQISRAAAVLRESIAWAEQSAGPLSTAPWLCNLGCCLRDAGRIDEALDAHLRALVIDCENGDQSGLVIDVQNCADCYGDLGETTWALHSIEFTINAWSLFDPDDGTLYANRLAARSCFLIDADRCSEASDTAEESIRLGHVSGYVGAIARAGYYLSLSRLTQGNPQEAYEASRTALETEFPRFGFRSLLVSGISLLHLQRPVEAQAELIRCANLCEDLLQHSEEHYVARLYLGLALCGTVVCGSQTAIFRAQELLLGIDALYKFSGVRARCLHLLNLIARADSTQSLQNLVDRIRAISPTTDDGRRSSGCVLDLPQLADLRIEVESLKGRDTMA